MRTAYFRKHCRSESEKRLTFWSNFPIYPRFQSGLVQWEMQKGENCVYELYLTCVVWGLSWQTPMFSPVEGAPVNNIAKFQTLLTVIFYEPRCCRNCHGNERRSPYPYMHRVMYLDFAAKTLCRDRSDLFVSYQNKRIATVHFDDLLLSLFDCLWLCLTTGPALWPRSLGLGPFWLLYYQGSHGHGKSWKKLLSWKVMEKSWNMKISQKVMESSWMSWKSHGIACSHGYGSFLVCDCCACCETVI